MLGKLDQIERRLQTLVEGSFSRLFPDGTIQNQLTHQLVLAMQSNLVTTEKGRVKAPTMYSIVIHPSRQEFWQKYRPFFDDLAQSLYQVGNEAGIIFTSPPAIYITIDPDMPVQEFRVSASLPKENSGETASISLANMDINPSIPSNSFLIVDGDKNFLLKLPVINIGRRSDNHLVITDPRVSRTHAQLRAIKGRFVVFDLGSTGGTQVNGQRINQHSLNPGDVISLAGVPLIYGQDLSSGMSDTDTININQISDTHPALRSNPSSKPNPQ
jgi:hypothetical protein